MGNHTNWGSAPNLVEALRLRSIAEKHERGCILFSQGEPPKGVFVIESGRAKLSLHNAKGDTALSRVAGPGTVLGLPAVVANKPFSLTAELLDDAQIRFVTRGDVIALMQSNVAIAMRVVEMLSDEVRIARDLVAAAAS